MTRAATHLARKKKGLLITVDEAQDAPVDDMREIAVAVQHLIRKKKNVALVFAGITTGVMGLINGQALTFLRRAKSEELASIPLSEVACALRETIIQSGLEISPEALEVAAGATVGYAYLIQLVGYHVWREGKAHAESSLEISESDAKRGVASALADFNQAVHEPAVADLPLRAIEYLLAMTEDEGASSTGEIARRLSVAPSSLTSYRRMLIKRQVIEQTAHGYVAFSIPYTREFLIGHREELLARYGRS